MYSVLFIFSLSLSLSKNKHHSTSSDASSNEDLAQSVSDEDHSEPKKITSSYSHGRTYFNYNGTLRQIFAIELSFQHAGGNVVCSPVSALLPLGKLVLGAEGKTRTELTNVIGDNKKSALKKSFTELIKKLQYIPGVKLNVASRIYVGEDAEIVPKFAESAKTIFHSGVETISFKEPKQAADEINGWVSRQTNGMIPLLLQPTQITPRTSMIIVNAVYFKGKWKDPFKEINIDEFHSPTGPKKVQLMRRYTTSCRYTKSDILNAEIIEIPYEGLEANFVIVLPLEKAGLPLLLNQLKLAPNLLNNALKKLKQRRVDLTIPKFSITTSFDLKEMYEKTGLKKMMSNKSGLKNIVKKQELKISSAIQQAVIEVHERGTEASAASAIVMAMGASPNMVKPVQFTPDHPFLFYVQAHTEQLFAGIFSDP